MKFSIIICTYNRDKYIYTTLKSIVLNEYPKDKYEIVLINNNSTDNTEKECYRFKSDFPGISFKYVIETQQGLSFARNRGINESTYDFLIFLDDDAFVKVDYLYNLEKQLNKYTDTDAFGGRIDPAFESGESPRWMSKWTYSWVSAIDKSSQVSLFKGNTYPIGANMGFFKRSISDVGNFNTALGRSGSNLMGGEEKDLFLRMKEKGNRIYYFPNVQVQHVIPEKRLTKEFIIRLAKSIGYSEKIRCQNKGTASFVGRLFNEIFKWGASFILWLYYVVQFQMQKGNILILFRWYVTLGLIGKYK